MLFRSIVVSAIVFANDHDGVLPRVSRKHNPDEPLDVVTSPDNGGHISWVHEKMFRYWEGHFADMTKFTCPNRGEGYIKTDFEPASSPPRARLGYYILFGRGPGSFNIAPTNPWRSPQRLSDHSRLVMTVDVIEKNTLQSLLGNNITHSSHGEGGGVVASESGQVPEPQAIGSAGGNLSYVDGSVDWIDQNDMVSHPANFHGGIRGYWPEDPLLGR